MIDHPKATRRYRKELRLTREEGPSVRSPSSSAPQRHEPVDLTRLGDFDITRASEYQGEANRQSVASVVWKAGIVLFFGVGALVAAPLTGAPWWACLLIGPYILIALAAIIYWGRIYRMTDPARSPADDRSGADRAGRSRRLPTRATTHPARVRDDSG